MNQSLDIGKQPIFDNQVMQKISAPLGEAGLREVSGRVSPNDALYRKQAASRRKGIDRVESELVIFLPPQNEKSQKKSQESRSCQKERSASETS